MHRELYCTAYKATVIDNHSDEQVVYMKNYSLR